MHFITEDNGGLTFFVQKNHRTLLIYKLPDKTDDERKTILKNPADYFTELVVKTPFLKIIPTENPQWAKKDKYSSFTPNNNILVRISKNVYMFIGCNVFTFKTKDVINKFYSPVGNSAVAYPYAIGESNTYLLIEYTYFPNDDLYSLKDSDPYPVLYHMSKKTSDFYRTTYKITHKVLS
jgi:hypothetical protein